MGAWGTGISSNDTYGDIYDQFMELYNEGRSHAEISERLIRENKETIGIEEDAPNFWYALAKAQWECRGLDKDVLDRVEDHILAGRDLEIWKELGASNSDLVARRKALDKFLAKLKSDRPAAKKRKKKKFYDSIFKKGDCLAYRMDNGNYGAAFVLKDEQATEVGVNYIAITTINNPEKPSLDDFRNADVFQRYAEETTFVGNELILKWVDQPQIGGFYALSFKNVDFEIEVIGRLALFREYEPPQIVGYGWKNLTSVLPKNDEYERINGKPKSMLKLSKWIKKPSLFSFFKRDW